MLKPILTICLWTMVFLLSGAQGWSEDIEDRFIDPDVDTSKTIFIDVKDVALVNVLKIFSQQSGLSFIATPDVADKKLTLYLNKIPLNQALQMILDANGLTYEMQKDSDIYFVKAKNTAAMDMITKVYQLKYASVSSSKLNSTINTSISSGGQNASAAASTSSGGSSSGAPSNGLEQVIKDALSAEGRVIEDTRTNSLIITDHPGQFETIDRTIANLDVPIPQVLIEVEMLDVSKSTADALGITYGATPLTFTGGSALENWPFGSGVGALSGGSGSSSGSSSTTSITTGWNSNGMTAALNFLSSKTDARTLARPRILTLNNETAVIQISTNQAVDILPSSSSSGTAGSTQSFTVDRFTTGVILKVTPQANLLTHEVTLAVSPRVIDVILSKVQPPSSIGGQIFDPETRGSDSILKLKDGQSMVIGGLMNDQTNETMSKLPFLGDLPVIGSVFRSTNKSKSERELLIFLTPHIIDDSNQLSLKGDISSMSAEAALDVQDASDRIQKVENTLNSYEK